jgi:hypothetical protein
MQILDTLQDIANYIVIKSSEFHISHSSFPSVELPDSTVVQLQKMSAEIQYKCLNIQLLNLIYSIYYEGSLLSEVSQGSQKNNQILQKIAAAEIDWEFYEQLEKNNQGKGWFHPDYLVVREETDGSLAVQYDGATINIQRNRHLQLIHQSATVGDLVAVWIPSSCIRNNFYMAFGDAVDDFDFGHQENSVKQSVLIYFNFSPEAAIAAMKSVTTKLNAIEVSFSFQVLHNPLNYGRYNSGVLRFNNDSYELVREVLQNFYIENKSNFQPQVPLFTKVLAPGIGLAERPVYRFGSKESFGINRCQIVANALLEAHKNGDESPKTRMKYILQHFDHLGIDLECPYLNPNSEDIYTPLVKLSTSS